MNEQEARGVLRNLLQDGEAWLSPTVLAALRVVLDAPAPLAQTATPAPPVASTAAPQPIPPPRPETPATTTQPSGGPTGFVGVFLCPSSFWVDDNSERWIPYEERDPALGWNRLLSFGGPGMTRPDRDNQTWLQKFVETTLPGRWTVEPIRHDDTIVIRLNSNIELRLPALDTFVRPVDVAGARHWDFKRGVSMYDMLTLLAHAAIERGFGPDREVLYAGGQANEVTLEVQRIALEENQQTIDSIETYLAWARRLAASIYQTIGRNILRNRRFSPYDELDASVRECWEFWVRNHPGMLRLELALRGFFENGGQQAVVGLRVIRDAQPETRLDFLHSLFPAGSVDQVVAPGLGMGWQKVIADFAAENAITAIIEAPRFIYSAPLAGQFVNASHRWMMEDTGYEGFLTPYASPLQEESAPTNPETAQGVFPWLVVENPLAMGSYDAYRLAPPSGHVAGGNAPVQGFAVLRTAIPDEVAATIRVVPV